MSAKSGEWNMSVVTSKADMRLRCYWFNDVETHNRPAVIGTTTYLFAKIFCAGRISYMRSNVP